MYNVNDDDDDDDVRLVDSAMKTEPQIYNI